MIRVRAYDRVLGGIFFSRLAHDVTYINHLTHTTAQRRFGHLGTLSSWHVASKQGLKTHGIPITNQTPLRTYKHSSRLKPVITQLVPIFRLSPN